MPQTITTGYKALLEAAEREKERTLAVVEMAPGRREQPRGAFDVRFGLRRVLLGWRRRRTEQDRHVIEQPV